MQRRRAPSSDAEVVSVSRAALVELLSVASATAHIHRFVDPPQMIRANEIRDLAADVAAQAGIDWSREILPGYRVWFDELAYYMRPGVNVPADPEHYDRWVQHLVTGHTEAPES